MEFESCHPDKWYDELDDAKPTAKAHTYALLKSIMATAESHDLILKNPCRIRGGSAVVRKSVSKPATLEEMAVIVTAMPERLQLLILLAAWCGLRWGELTELRRSDLDLEFGIVNVQRATTLAGRKRHVGTTKSPAGVRQVSIPPHILPAIRQHLLSEFCQFGRDGLLFPAAKTRTPSFARTADGAEDDDHLSAGNAFWGPWDRARRAAGRPDLRLHDLRHTSATMASRVPGTTVVDLMSRYGWSTQAMAVLYTHADSDRNAAIARGMSEAYLAATNPTG